MGFGPVKRIDVGQSVRYFNHTFAEIIYPLGRNNVYGTLTYTLQVDYAHLIHELQMSPQYNIPKLISDINAFLERARAKAKNGK